ncbi:MAG: cryptochrome/photolyase family protein [Flavobacteriales bacterium]
MHVFWFRRDLRLHDNAGLYHALKSGQTVQALFIFDRHILDKLGDRYDARVTFIYRQIERLKKELSALGADLMVRYGMPEEILPELVKQLKAKTVFTNHDYEPYARERDAKMAEILKSLGVAFHTFKDQCIFEKDEVLKDDGKPYTVFTPYSRKWKSKVNAFYLKPYPNEEYFHHFRKTQAEPLIALEQMNFKPSKIDFPSHIPDRETIRRYKTQRDYPAIKGTSRLSVHLRFGTISIRQLAAIGLELSEGYLNELIWRDFYFMIIWHFPHSVDKAFKPAYDQVPWRNSKEDFERWCEGQTGYPIVDAGMRELNTTGFMHNRVRMIVASFLTKHLLIDWRWGEAYFAAKLLDFELSSNVGGWQWAASSGCDAAPYFRVFNPDLQTQKFDPKLEYVRKWVPEFEDFTRYPRPMVDHKFARERVLKAYKEALGS